MSKVGLSHALNLNLIQNFMIFYGFLDKYVGLVRGETIMVEWQH